MIETSKPNLFHLDPFSSLILLTMFSITLLFQFTFAEPRLNNSYLSNSTSDTNIYPLINGTYTISSEGFQIMLPDGWSGIDLSLIAMVSPTGIDLKTGSIKPGGDKVLMVLGSANVSDFVEDIKHSNSSQYRDYIEKTAESVGCKVLSDKFIRINGMKSEELTEQCGSHGEEKIRSYAFASSKKIIFVGLKGRGSMFDNNLEKFKQSVQTIKFRNATDVEELLLGIK